VGLLSAALTAPLAPLRMVLWVAENLAAHAESDAAHQPLSVPERLRRIDEALAAGEITADQAADLEDEVLSQLDVSALDEGGRR
jgi:polyhydroxyalkanoate synthesis regulator phasin